MKWIPAATLALSLAFGAGWASAASVYQLSVEGSAIDGATGVIALETMTGNSTGDVAAFSLAGRVTLGDLDDEAFDLGIGDIGQIGWEIDDDGVLSIGLVTNVLSLNGGGLCIFFAISSPRDVSCRVNGITSRVSDGLTRAGATRGFPGGGVTNNLTGLPIAAPQAPVPLPAPAFLLLAGLAALGLHSRRRT